MSAHRYRSLFTTVELDLMLKVAEGDPDIDSLVAETLDSIEKTKTRESNSMSTEYLTRLADQGRTEDFMKELRTSARAKLAVRKGHWNFSAADESAAVAELMRDPAIYAAYHKVHFPDVSNVKPFGAERYPADVQKRWREEQVSKSNGPSDVELELNALVSELMRAAGETSKPLTRLEAIAIVMSQHPSLMQQLATIGQALPSVAPSDRSIAR